MKFSFSESKLGTIVLVLKGMGKESECAPDGCVLVTIKLSKALQFVKLQVKLTLLVN